jgi:penicillin-binding protein-related factor A (putative recombinase)
MKKPAWLDAQEEFASWWVGKEQWCYAFHDTREAMGAAGSRRVFTDERPADFLVTSFGHTFLAEVKSCSDKASFPFSNIQRGQWKAAVRSVAAGGDYFFYIRSESRTRWFKVHAKHVLQHREEGHQSMKWDIMEQCNYVV